MEIRIPLISYGKRNLIDGVDDVLILADTYVRWIGRSKYDMPKVDHDGDDSEYEREERVFNYDVAVIKDKISIIDRCYNFEDKCWEVSIHSHLAGITLRYESKAEANLMRDKIHRWYFEGIVE